MKLNNILDESITSEVGRKIKGEVSASKQAKRIGRNAMQQAINVIDLIRQENINDPNKLRKILDDIRKEQIDAVTALKKVED